MTGPIGYVTYFQTTNTPLIKRILFSFIEAQPLFTRFGMETTGTLVYPAKRVIDQLPPVTFLQIGQEPTTPFVQPVQDYQESVALARDNCDIDWLWLKDKQYIESDPLGIHLRAYAQSLKFTFNNYLINNSRVGGTVGDANGFVGLKFRLTTPGFFGNNSAMQISAATQSISMAYSALSGLNWVLLQGLIQQTFDHMGSPDGSGVKILGNPQILRKINQSAQLGGGFGGTTGSGGGFTTSKDAIGRTVTKFREAEILSVGYQAPVPGGKQTAPIITSTQDTNGWDAGDPLYNPAQNTYTSLYFIREGPDHFHFWQHSDPTMVRVQVSGTRKWRVMLDTSVGIYQPDTRAIARIYGINTDGSSQD